MTDKAQTASPPPAPPPLPPRLELRLEPGSEGVIRLVTVAPTTLSLSLDGRPEENGRRYKVKLKGTQKNLPKDATCRVIVKAYSLDTERDSELGGVAMQINGESCTVEVELDVFESGLFGQGHAQLTVIPDFPFATGCVVPTPVPFNNPLNVEGVSTDPHKREIRQLGEQIELDPVFSKKFQKSTLKFSIFHGGAIESGKASDSLAYSVFEWTADEAETKHWRVGCAESDGTPILTYLETRKDVYSFDLRLEVLQETEGKEVSYLLWERPSAISFPKPKLTSFEISAGRAIAKMEGVHPSFDFPLELTLWQYGYHDLDPIVRTLVMSPLSRPAQAVASSSEYFWQLMLPNGSRANQLQQAKIFALLRIPKTLSGTDTYVPVSTVMDYDASKFLTFDDDQLWLEPPPKKRNAQQARQKKTPKDLATAIASKELAIGSEELKSHPTRTPHFGSISTGVRDNNLLVSIKLVGDAGYWKAAEPVFAIYDESGQTETVKLTTKPSDQNPRILDALLPLDDKRILGQKVSIRGKVTKPDAQLWEELVAAPPAFAVTYECVPLLGPPEKHDVELTDDTSYIQVQCRTRHIPNGKNGTTLGFRLYEYFAGVEKPIELTAVKFRYDVAKGTSGQCDSQGRLVARITDQVIVEKLLGQGKFKLEACVQNKDGKVLGTEVPSTSIDFGKSPRRIEGTMVWGKLVPAEFRKKVLVICDLLKIEADYLMACMHFETQGSFSASKQNNGGAQAYGLIQFTKAGTEGLGKTVDELKVMTELEQLDYVYKFMNRCIQAKGPLTTLSDVYMAIICPEAVGKPDTYCCYSKATSPLAYSQNQPLDTANKGFITKADATAPVAKAYKDGQTYRL